MRAAGGGGRMTPSAPGSEDLRWEGRLAATVSAPPSTPTPGGRDRWEAPSAPRKKEGEGRAWRGVRARQGTRAPATRSWGGCPGDAPPQGAATSPKTPVARKPQELGPEPSKRRSVPNAQHTTRRTGPKRVPRLERVAAAAWGPRSPAGSRERGWGLRPPGPRSEGSRGPSPRARAPPPLTHRARRAPPRTSTRCRCGNS